MLGSGALLIYDNLADRADVFDPEGDWIDPQHLLRPQLHPYASLEGPGAVVLEFEQTQYVNALALLGTGGDEIRTVGVEEWDVLTEEWKAVGVDVIRARATPFSPAHIVISARNWISARKFRVSFGVQAGKVAEIGSLYIGRMIQHEQLADGDWILEPIQKIGVEESDGGQLFGHGGQPRRQLRVNNGTMDPETLFGHFPSLEEIEVPEPDSISGWTQLEPGLFELQAGATGEVNWEGLLNLSNSSQHAYLLRYDYYGFDLTSANPFFSAVSLRKHQDGSFLETFQGVAQGLGWATVKAGNSSPDMRIEGDLSEYSGGARIQFRIQSLHLISAPRPSGTDPITAVDLGLSLHSVMAHSGRAKPIIVILRTSDPVWFGPTMIYGYVDRWQPYGHRGGDYFGGGFSITETL